MRVIAALTTLAFLAACGVDGAPLRPSANVGIGIGSNGVSLGGKASVGKGPVTVSVGL
ncbi:hypothetical protein WG622_12390 [Cognatishimia sp. D5M38]|mgnify:CR=1 FL=1|uniref:Argininosuccinate lyase n=2 Tax=Cognatishimia TaxID=2211635 RepID=A0A975ER23_9RHOB|nr:hypothetical protein [Cognatishimia activa]NQY59135.1 hypothetical protein [Cognatishimia sp.]QTN36644.1 hypothetical protein HZ995_03740 [Cognatishimia activa]